MASTRSIPAAAAAARTAAAASVASPGPDDPVEMPGHLDQAVRLAALGLPSGVGLPIRLVVLVQRQQRDGPHRRRPGWDQRHDRPEPERQLEFPFRGLPLPQALAGLINVATARRGCGPSQRITSSVSRSKNAARSASSQRRSTSRSVRTSSIQPTIAHVPKATRDGSAPFLVSQALGPEHRNETRARDMQLAGVGRFAVPRSAIYTLAQAFELSWILAAPMR